MAEQSGYFCLFTEDFLVLHDRHAGLQESPLFKIGSDPVFFLNEAQLNTVRHLFRQLLAEHSSEYLYKQDLLRSYVNLLVHEALKMQPFTGYERHPNAASRIVALFTELLERQFPIESRPPAQATHRPQLRGLPVRARQPPQPGGARVNW